MHDPGVLWSTAGCVDVDLRVGQCMYGWSSKSFNETVCVHDAMWVIHTEIRCQGSITESNPLSGNQKAREYTCEQEARRAPHWSRVEDKNLPFGDTPLSGGILLVLPSEASQLMDRSSPHPSCDMVQLPNAWIMTSCVPIAFSFTRCWWCNACTPGHASRSSRPGHAVALRLPGHDDDIEREQLFDELDVLSPEAIAVWSLGHLRTEHRIVLGKRVVPFDLEVGLAVPGDAVEEDRFLDRRDEGVPDATEHGVIGPDSQVVLAALGQAPRVVSEVALGVIDVDPEGLGDRGVHSPAASLDVIGRDERIGRRVIAVLVDEPDRVEHLHRMVGVETGIDLRDCADVAVDELAQTTVVVHSARARAPSDEELKVRDAECVLDVDGEEAEAKGILCRWA